MLPKFDPAVEQIQKLREELKDTRDIFSEEITAILSRLRLLEREPIVTAHYVEGALKPIIEELNRIDSNINLIGQRIMYYDIKEKGEEKVNEEHTIKFTNGSTTLHEFYQRDIEEKVNKILALESELADAKKQRELAIKNAHDQFMAAQRVELKYQESLKHNKELSIENEKLRKMAFLASPATCNDIAAKELRGEDLIKSSDGSGCI